MKEPISWNSNFLWEKFKNVIIAVSQKGPIRGMFYIILTNQRQAFIETMSAPGLICVPRVSML